MGRLRRRALGLSVHGSRVSWAEVTRCLGRTRVERSGTLDAGIIPERPPWRRPDRVIVGVARQAVAFRWLERPDVDHGHLAGLLAYEVEGHFPFPADEVASDFVKLRRRGNRADVLLVGTRKETVAQAVERVTALGVAPTAIDVSTLAATNALLVRKRLRAAELGCLVEIDGAEATVSAVRDAALLASRVLTLGDDAGAVLVTELRRVLAATPSRRARIFVSGASADLSAQIGAALGVATEAWSPGPAGVDIAALGLALRGLRKVPLRIDLLPSERRAKRREWALTATIALLAVVGLLGVGLGLGAAYRERRELNEVTRRLAEVKRRAAEVDRVAAHVQRLTTRLQLLEQVAGERELPLRVLRELASRLPADAELSEVVSDWPRLQIRGTTISSPSGLIAAFEQSTLFENAAFTAPIAPMGDRQGFQIRMTVKGR